MQRHDADVVEALTRLRLREIGGRVEHDRRVVGRQVHGSDSPRWLADRIAWTRSSIGAALLDEADCAGGENRAAIGVGRLRRQAEDSAPGRRSEHCCRRLCSVEARQPEVHQDDIGIERLAPQQRPRRRRRPSRRPRGRPDRRAAARASSDTPRCPRRATRARRQVTPTTTAVGSAADRLRGSRSRVSDDASPAHRGASPGPARPLR